jgi:type III pantothenate kinase
LLAHSGLKKEDVNAAVIGTVVPAALYHLRRLCREWFEVEPLIARASLDWGFEIRIDNPDEVGADRLLNALSGHRRFGGPMIVVDFGTATTFDVVDHTGAYLGGVICPGINLSIEALHQAAARLPRMGYIGLIEGLLGRIKAEFGGPMKVVATGGLAPLFAEGTMMIEHIEPDLTLDGLRLLAERNPAPALPRERTRMLETE